ncbi:MAG: hypothetical protein RL095_1769 [Verrucomicrobiota bacterium]|jgi:hypothetical protein
MVGRKKGSGSYLYRLKERAHLYSEAEITAHLSVSRGGLKSRIDSGELIRISMGKRTREELRQEAEVAAAKEQEEARHGAGSHELSSWSVDSVIEGLELARVIIRRVPAHEIDKTLERAQKLARNGTWRGHGELLDALFGVTPVNAHKLAAELFPASLSQQRERAQKQDRTAD